MSVNLTFKNHPKIEHPKEITAALKEKTFQFVIFNPVSYCFEETIGFDVKVSFASRPVLRLIR